MTEYFTRLMILYLMIIKVSAPWILLRKSLSSEFARER